MIMAVKDWGQDVGEVPQLQPRWTENLGLNHLVDDPEDNFPRQES